MPEVAAETLRYGARITGHPDVDEDLVWFFCGIVVGAPGACDPTPPIVRTPERSRQDADA